MGRANHPRAIIVLREPQGRYTPLQPGASCARILQSVVACRFHFDRINIVKVPKVQFAADWALRMGQVGQRHVFAKGGILTCKCRFKPQLGSNTLVLNGWVF